MPQDKLQKLKALLEIANQDTMSKAEFLSAFKQITDIFVTMKSTNAEQMKEMVKLFKDKMNIMDKVSAEYSAEMKAELSAKKDEMMNYCETEMDKIMKEQANSLNFIRDKVRTLQNGKDADEEKIVKDVLAKIPPPVTPKEETPIETRDKLESIKEEKEKLSISAISELRKELDELKARPVGRGGGGTSAMGVAQAFKYIAHTEEPTGAINGVNLTYTVKNTIWWIAGFTLNGEQIAELPNYTYSGHTITFSTALSAAYSGNDWEIKYIGT